MYNVLSIFPKSASGRNHEKNKTDRLWWQGKTITGRSFVYATSSGPAHFLFPLENCISEGQLALWDREACNQATRSRKNAKTGAEGRGGYASYCGLQGATVLPQSFWPGWDTSPSANRCVNNLIWLHVNLLLNLTLLIKVILCNSSLDLIIRGLH